MENPERKTVEPGIGDIPEERIFGISAIDRDLFEINWVPVKGRGIPRKFFVGLGATGGLLVLTGCVPLPIPPTETPIVTETTGIPPTPTLEITPTPTEIPPTPTPTEIPPIPTVTPEAYLDELKLALGGEWEEVRFGEEVVGYRIDNLEFVLPNFEVELKDWDATHFLIRKENQRIAPLVALSENQVAKFNDKGEIEVYDSQTNLLGTFNPDISWSLSPLGDDLTYLGKETMVRLRLDSGDRPIVEAFRPQDLMVVKSSLPQRLQSLNLPEGSQLFAVVGDGYWGLEERRLAEKWLWAIPPHQTIVWQPGEPVEPVIEAIEKGPQPTPEPENWTYIEGVPFVGFSEQDLAYIKDALTWGKEVVPEVLNFIVETNVAKVVYNPEVIGPWTIPPYPIQMPTGKFYREDVSIDTRKALFINTLDHESQHVRDLRRRGLNAPRGICSSEYPREQWLEDEVIACQRSAETLSRLIPHVSPEDQPYLQRLKEGYQLIVEEPERLTCPS